MQTFLYLTLGDGRATIAINQVDNNAEIAAAFCSPRDRFNKETGRKIALERLNNKNGFYVHFERNNDKLKWQVRDIVKFVISGEWVTQADIENELEMRIFNLVTEIETDFPNDFAPMTVHTNTVPTWAKRAVLEKNLY